MGFIITNNVNFKILVKYHSINVSTMKTAFDS